MNCLCVQKFVNNCHETIKSVCRNPLMCLLGVVCFSYAIWERKFAKLHVMIPRIDIPFFVGEMILVLAVLCLLFFYRKRISRKASFFWGCYLMIVFCKLVFGYVNYGSLAFRHAALFYYPVFSFITYSVFDRKMIRNEATLISFMLLGVLVVPGVICYSYFIYPILILFLLVGRQVRGRALKIAEFSTVILCAPYLALLSGTRTNLVSFSAAFLCLCVLSFRKIIVHTLNVKWLFFFAGSVLILFGIWRFSDSNERSSLINITKVFSRYSDTLHISRELYDSYSFRHIPVRLYGETVEEEKDPRSLKQKVYENILEKTDLLKQEESQEALQERVSNEPNNNILWRLLVWQDMILDYVHSNILFGVHFGKPFRSPSVESLGWNRVEIERVGWVEPHNSFVHIVYRMGLLGAVMCLVLVYVIGQMIRSYWKMPLLSSACLISIIIYWLVSAQFMVFLELPFFAIPFWCLFGVICKYILSSNRVRA